MPTRSLKGSAPARGCIGQLLHPPCHHGQLQVLALHNIASSEQPLLQNETWKSQAYLDGPLCRIVVT